MWKFLFNIIIAFLLFTPIFSLAQNIASPSDFSSIKLWLMGDSILTSTFPIVDQLYDLSTNNNHAVQIDNNTKPTIIVNGLNGHNVIHFDGIDDFLVFNEIDNVRTAFWVLEEDIAATLNFRSLFGHSSTYTHFLRSLTDKFIFGAATSPFIVNGETRLNSMLINGSSTIMPTDYSIISQITKGNTIISNFSSDRLLSGRVWHGNIAEIIVYSDSLTDTERTSIENYLRYKYFPADYQQPVNLGSDINSINKFCDTLIDAGSSYVEYLWSTGDTTQILSVNNSGEYYVAVKDIYGYISRDTIQVTFPTINQLTNNTICQGNSIPWNTNLSNSTYNFEWNDSSTDSLLTISQPGDYWVKVTDSLGCFKYSDTITITVDSFPTQTTLGIDKTVCQGATIGLEVGNNVISYLWNTNDTTAQITIDTAGIYWVQTQNNVGCVASDTIQITVNGIAPTVIFNAINTCNNSPTLFNNTSFTTDGSNIISYFWTFETGGTSNLQNPSYYYLATGNYTVTLQIETDSGCTNTLTQQIQVHKKPTAGFFPTNSLMCSDQNALFTNNSFSSDGVINSWLWDFGVAGNTDTSSLQNGNYAYAIVGNYSVQLIVTTEFGCSDTVVNLVNIKPSPTANFIIQDSCLTNQTKFTNLSTGTISTTNWDFGDANSSSLLNPFHVYANSGSYDVKLAIKATNGCWDTLIKPLTIYDNPVADFITDDYCVLSNYQLMDNSTTNMGNLTSWQWDISSLAFQSNNQNPTINFNYGDSGIHQLKLKVINNFGCKDSITKTIGVYPLPVPNFEFSPEIGLPPLVVDFTNLSYGGSLSYWNFGDGNSSIVNSPTYTYQDLGVYSVTLHTTSLFGCIDSISKTIQIIEPIIDLVVKNIYYEFVPNTNFMKISVQLGNEGRVTIKNMDLILQNSSTVTILETWSGNLAPNLQNIYTFSSMIEMPNGEIPSLICVTATNINRGIDANLSNNEFCKALNKFELINIYPNPTSKDLFLEFISPDVSTLEINLFDNTGNLVSNLFSGQSSKGINRKSFVMSIYSQGLYIIEIKNQEEIIRKKLVIE